jgi:hypothetical protein
MLRQTRTLCHLELFEDSSFNARPFFPEVIAGLAHNDTVERLEVKIYEFYFDLYNGMLESLESVLRTNTRLREIEIAYLKLYRDDPAMSGPHVLKVCQVLQQCPRYHKLQMRGLACGELSDELGLPERTEGWFDEDAVEYMQDVHFEKILGFAMGRHARLGSVSIVQQLNDDCVKLVVSSFFGLPPGYLDE